MGRTARLALGRVAVHGEHDLGSELAGPGDGLVEVLDLEPQQHPVAADQRGVADRPVVVVDLEVVQLEDEPVAVDQTLVLLPAVVAATAQETLVPAAAGLDVDDGEQGLWAHGRMLGGSGYRIRPITGSYTPLHSHATDQVRGWASTTHAATRAALYGSLRSAVAWRAAYAPPLRAAFRS